jgi:hypothetical protein
MSQLTAGTVSVVNGNATVTAALGVDWTAVTTSCLFVAAAEPDVLYSIIAVNAGASPPTLTLGVPYVGETNALAEYAIHIDFTPNGLPLIGSGDIATRPLLRRMVIILDPIVVGGGGGGGGGGAVNSVFGRSGTIVAQSGDYTMALIADTANFVRMTAAERNKLSLIQDAAQVNPAIATQSEAEAGADNVDMMTALRVAQAITARGGGGGGGGVSTLTPVHVPGNTDVLASGTFRRYQNTTSTAVSVSNTLGSQGECLLIRDPTAGDVTITPIDSLTINGATTPVILDGLALVKGDGGDVVISGDIRVAKTIPGTITFPGAVTFSSPIKVGPVVSTAREITSLPATLGTGDNNSFIAINATGTLNVPVANTLCPNAGDAFACVVVSGTGAITIDGAGGATNVSLVQFDIATIIARNSGSVWVAKAPGTIIAGST